MIESMQGTVKFSVKVRSASQDPRSGAEDGGL